jgi:glutathione peroxidase
VHLNLNLPLPKRLYRERASLSLGACARDFARYITSLNPNFPDYKQNDILLPMLKVLILLLLTIMPIANAQSSLYDLSATSIEGTEIRLSDYRGKVVLIVNTASNCGFTGQLDGLEKVYKKYQDQGLIVLGFPSNDFLGQEPASNSEIKAFCSNTYGTTFPLFNKAPVTGSDKQPVFKFLTELSLPELQGSVKWNFEKFLLDRNGLLRERYSSFTKPESEKLTKKIEELLAEAK